MTHHPRDLEWQRRYEENDTPWDKGLPAPPLVSFLREKSISGRVLIPGCGKGHEVRLLGAQRDTSAVGLDISTTAIAQAKALSGLSAEKGNVTFQVGDFFNLGPDLKNAFDWIVEHTCFCAIEPQQRPDYVLAASAALRDGGKFFGIFYLTPNVESGPPFEVSRAELSRQFDPHFKLLEEWVPTDAFPGREGRELVRLMQKR
jgi:methyl halide transferase